MGALHREAGTKKCTGTGVHRELGEVVGADEDGPAVTASGKNSLPKRVCMGVKSKSLCVTMWHTASSPLQDGLSSTATPSPSLVLEL